MSKTFFIGCTHFNHYNIIKYTNRPFKSIEEMNNFMIKQWNKIVKKNDTVWHLGDFALGSFEHGQKLLSSLNGKIHLIRGNHDRRGKHMFEKMGFVSVQKKYEMELHEVLLLLTHKPQPDEVLKKGQINLHSHNHLNFSDNYNYLTHISATVELHNYQPQTLQQLLNFQKKIINYGGVYNGREKK